MLQRVRGLEHHIDDELDAIKASTEESERELKVYSPKKCLLQHLANCTVLFVVPEREREIVVHSGADLSDSACAARPVPRLSAPNVPADRGN